MKEVYSKTPFLFLLLGLVAGILLSDSVGWYGLILIVLIPVFYFFAVKVYHNYCAFLLAFLLGIVSYQQNAGKPISIHFEALPSTVFCQLEVLEVKKTAKKEQLTVAVILTDVDEIKNRKLLVYVPQQSGYIVGDILLLDSKLISFQKPSVPDQFDFNHYYLSKGFVAQAFPTPNKLVKIGHVKSFNYYIEHFRDHLRNNLDELIAANAERAIIKALVVGDRQELSTDLKTVYVTAGIFHVLAVSGLHVGVVYLVIIFLLRFVPTKALKLTLLLTSLLFYACLTGLSTSVIRASVMFLFFGISQIYQLKTSTLNILFASCFFILFFCPVFLFEPGFQLSISAVLGILLFFSKIEGVLIFKYYLFNKLWSFVSVSLAAQVLTTPLILYYFHQFPTYAILINVIVVFLIQFVLVFASLAAVLGKFFGLGCALASMAEWLCYWINQFATVVSHWPMSRIMGIHLEPIQVFCLIFSALFLYGFLGKRQQIFYYGLCATIIIFLSVSFHRFTTYANQSYLAFHKVKNRLVIEKVEGKKALIYFDTSKLSSEDLKLTFLNYWARRNISIFEIRPMKTYFSLGDDFFTVNSNIKSPYHVRIDRSNFEVIDENSRLIFSQKSNASLSLPKRFCRQ